MNYNDFLYTKVEVAPVSGFDVLPGDIHPALKPHQRDAVMWAIKGVDSLRNLWRNYPDLWALLMKWDLDSPVTFKADGHTVHDFDKRFRMEEEGWIDMARPFRWAMLGEPPKFRAINFEEISLFDTRR